MVVVVVVFIVVSQGYKNVSEMDNYLHTNTEKIISLVIPLQGDLIHYSPLLYLVFF